MSDTVQGYLSLIKRSHLLSSWGTKIVYRCKYIGKRNDHRQPQVTTALRRISLKYALRLLDIECVADHPSQDGTKTRVFSRSYILLYDSDISYVSKPSCGHGLLRLISFIFPSTFSIFDMYVCSAFICTKLDSNPTSTLDTPSASFISFVLYTARVDAFFNHPKPPQIGLLPQWYWRTWQLPQTRYGGRSFFPPESFAFRAIPRCPILPRLRWKCLKTACIRRSRGWLNRKGSRVKVYLKMVHMDRGARKLRGTQTAFIQ